MLRSQSSLVVATLTLALVACDSVTAPPDAATPAAAATAPSAAAAAAAGAQERVTGNAHISIFTADVEHYQFSAIRHRDGSVSGQFELASTQEGGLRIHGELRCFRITGNQARLAGVITQSTNPAYDNLPVFWTVIDNGEGANDPPDQTSDFFVGGPPEQLCDIPFVLPLLTVEQGNIQVHTP